MNKKFILILVVILIIIAGGVFYFLYKQQPPQVNIQNNTTYSQTSNFAFYPIHEIKLNKFNSGTYNTEGYVVKIYTCPPCPKRAQCKPCMRDNIVISENNKLLETYTLSDKEMVLFVNNPKQFELGEKYTFSIKILDYKTTGEPINDVEIIGYSLANDDTNILRQNIIASSIIGKWEVVSVQEDGIQIVSDGNGAVIEFFRDGTYKASGGCNEMFVSSYEMQPDSKLSIKAGGTKRKCAKDIVEFWDLGKVYSYEFTDSFLLLHYKTEGGGVGFFKLSKLASGATSDNPEYCETSDDCVTSCGPKIGRGNCYNKSHVTPFNYSVPPSPYSSVDSIC
ncbi:MAG: META domain-containing protein, partial [bacterium]